MKNTSGIRPLGDTLLIDITPAEQRTAAGIVLPTAVQGASTNFEGTIVELGPQCERAELQPGTKVYVGKYCSNDLIRGERRYRLAPEHEIVAVLEDIAPSMPEPVVTPIQPH
jgi:chaperonin GroES